MPSRWCFFILASYGSSLCQGFKQRWTHPFCGFLLLGVSLNYSCPATCGLCPLSCQSFSCLSQAWLGKCSDKKSIKLTDLASSSSRYHEYIYLWSLFTFLPCSCGLLIQIFLLLYFVFTYQAKIYLGHLCSNLSLTTGVTVLPVFLLDIFNSHLALNLRSQVPPPKGAPMFTPIATKVGPDPWDSK